VEGYQLVSQALIDDANKDLATLQKAKDSTRSARVRELIDTLEKNRDSSGSSAAASSPVSHNRTVSKT